MVSSTRLARLRAGPVAADRAVELRPPEHAGDPRRGLPSCAVGGAVVQAHLVARLHGCRQCFSVPNIMGASNILTHSPMARPVATFVNRTGPSTKIVRAPPGRWEALAFRNSESRGVDLYGR